MDETERLLSSTEVVGNFTDTQKQEFAYLGGQIIEAEGFDTDNEEHIEQVKGVLADCIARGLKSLGRVWFGSNESITDVFDIGLSQRESIVNNFKKMVDSGEPGRLFSDEEGSNLIGLQNHTTVFATSLSEQEDVLEELRRRQGVIGRFHQVLFRESSLAPLASRLRDEIPEKKLGARMSRPEEIEDRLYQNLLINLSLYPGTQPAILIEPKDIAALAEVWQEPGAFNISKQRVSDSIKKLAQRFNLDEKVMEIYTTRMLEVLFFMAQPNLNIEELKSSNIGIVPETTLELEEEELSMPGVKPEMVSISQAEFDRAKEKFMTAYQLAEAWVQEAEKPDELFNEEETSRLGNEFDHFLNSLTPFELVLFLSKINSSSQTAKIFAKTEFEDSIPHSTFVDALKFAEAKGLKVDGKGDIEGLTEDGLNILRKKIEGRVIDDITTNEVNLGEVIDELPVPFIAQFVNTVPLYKQQGQLLVNLDTRKWIMLCQHLEVQYRGKGDEVKFEDLDFPPEAEVLKRYLQSMPEDKQRDIFLGIRRIITF